MLATSISSNHILARNNLLINQVSSVPQQAPWVLSSPTIWNGFDTPELPATCAVNNQQESFMENTEKGIQVILKGQFYNLVFYCILIWSTYTLSILENLYNLNCVNCRSQLSWLWMAKTLVCSQSICLLLLWKRERYYVNLKIQGPCLSSWLFADLCCFLCIRNFCTVLLSCSVFFSPGSASDAFCFQMV